MLHNAMQSSRPTEEEAYKLRSSIATAKNVSMFTNLLYSKHSYRHRVRAARKESQYGPSRQQCAPALLPARSTQKVHV
jgi:hypothetical protein